jgi:DNA-directed RNA polymerase subunit RPC12/RpoP
MITPQQLQHLLQMQAQALKQMDPAVRRKRDAEVFARFAVSKGMIDKTQFETAMRLFEASSDPNKTMAQLMIEMGMLTEQQVTEISMMQQHIAMRCSNCKIKFTIVTTTNRKEIPCPKCGKLLERVDTTTTIAPINLKAASTSPAKPPVRPQLMTQVFRAVKPVAQPPTVSKKIKTKCVVCDFPFEGEMDGDRRVTCPSCSTSFTIL